MPLVNFETGQLRLFFGLIRLTHIFQISKTGSRAVGHLISILKIFDIVPFAVSRLYITHYVKNKHGVVIDYILVFSASDTQYLNIYRFQIVGRRS